MCRRLPAFPQLKVRYSPRAIDDLAGIADCVRERSLPKGARSVERAIRSTVGLIGSHPGLGRALEQRPNVRVIPVTRYPYLVLFTKLNAYVLIVHIRHGARPEADPNEI